MTSQFSPGKILTVVLGCVIGGVAMFSGVSEPYKEEQHWYKGNTHTHTTNSDGDGTPDEVVQWYRTNGYHFVFVTDHNALTDVGNLNAVHGVDGTFLVMTGEEVTDEFDDHPVHINALNVGRLVSPQHGKSISDVVQRNVDAIRAARGLPQVNHPNFTCCARTITADDLKEVGNAWLLEIHNGLVNNLGGPGVLSVEEIWDVLLSKGKLIYGVAVDDAHHFKRPGDSEAAAPGRGWVMVRTNSLSLESIVTAMERGDFYSSTGVELEDYTVKPDSINIAIKQAPSKAYRVQFIGRNGRILSEVSSNPAVYRFQGDEGYVRARVLDSSGGFAWTQPKVVDSSIQNEVQIGGF